MSECIECGDEVEESNAVYGSGTVREDALEDLADGETVGADDLFGFDDGPYCSLDCSLNGGKDE